MTTKNLVLIGGASSTGKSASLMNLENPTGVLYLNCEHKELPFKSKFIEQHITDPLKIFDFIVWAEKQPEVHTIVIDSISYLLDMFETKYVVPAADGRKAWGDYGQYVKKLFHTYCAGSSKDIVVLGHLTEIYDEGALETEYKVACKGATKNLGIESYFTSVVHTVKVPVAKLKEYTNPLLCITDEDKALGMKYCFQTKINKDSIGRRIRSPLGMWDITETYIDNDVSKLLTKIKSYYE